MPRDFVAGLLLLLICAVLVYGGADLEFGTASAMGPGFLPFLAAGGMALLSAALMISGLASAGPKLGRIGFRPIVMVSLAGIAFAVLLHKAGVLAATAAVVVLCSFAIRDLRWKEVIPAAIGMAAFVGFLFVYLLKLPMDL